MNSSNCDTLATRLVNEYHARLRAFVFSRTHDYETTDEVAQEVFLAVLKRVETYDQSRPAWPWILGVARNKLKEYWRQKARRTGDRLEAFIAQEELLREGEGGEDALECEMSALESCMESLPSVSRRLVEMSYTQRLTSDEMARELGRRAGAIRVALHKIRQRLSLCIMTRMEIISG